MLLIVQDTIVKVLQVLTMSLPNMVMEAVLISLGQILDMTIHNLVMTDI